MSRNRQRDPVEEARKQAASQFQQQRQAQASAYAAARFNEWQQNAAQREQNLQYRNQILQSQAEMAGLKTMSDLYDQGEIDRQTKIYLSGMPVLREQLKNAGISPGDPRYAAEISAFAQHIPDAFTHVPEIQKRLTDLSKTDATAAEIAGKFKTVQQGLTQAGLRGTSLSSTATGDVDVKSTRPLGGDPATDLFQSHKITPTQFLNVPPEQLQLGNVNTSGVFKPDLQGKMIQFPVGVDEKGAARSVRMSVPEFNARKLAFSQQETVQTPQTATQSSVPVTTPAPAATPATQASLDDIFGQQNP